MNPQLITELALIISSLTLIFTAAREVRERTRKLLTYDVTSNRRLITKKEVSRQERELVDNRLKVIFDATTVDDVDLVKIKIRNSTFNKDIQSQDYHMPLKF